jgi:hypothetical protein
MNGQTSVTVAESSGYSSPSTVSEKLKEARAMVVRNRRVGIAEIAEKLIGNQGSLYSVAYDRLGIRKVCARLVLRQLTKEQKHCNMGICSFHLECYYNDGENYLNCIIIVDETTIQHYEPKSR